MTIQSDYYKSNSVFCSIRTTKAMQKEQFVSDHVLIHILSGRLDIVEADCHSSYHCGDTLFVRRNSLAKFIKFPQNDGEPFKSLSIFIKRSFLRTYYAMNRHHLGITQHPGADVRIKKIEATPLLQGYFASLGSYFDADMKLTEELVEIKTREAMFLLNQIDPPLYRCLFHFVEPGKIDLEEFMCKNFVFNVPLETFSKMTGRSLSTFKRDFHKIFDQSPSRWLKKKRLEFAHYLLKEKHRPPSDVYLQAGFENLSHFSSSFKEVYGYNPSDLVTLRTKRI
ncbi:MAG: helix-turn-helix transcriptional regulator [Deltaproteobacteria bacterium]|nr:helix-turn-helix transcriptional regulator [Deltaproteobacteria bacterium]